MLNKIFLFMRWYEEWEDIESAPKLSNGRRYDFLYFSVHNERAFYTWKIKSSISFSLQYHDNKGKPDKITYHFLDYKKLYQKR